MASNDPGRKSVIAEQLRRFRQSKPAGRHERSDPEPSALFWWQQQRRSVNEQGVAAMAVPSSDVGLPCGKPQPNETSDGGSPLIGVDIAAASDSAFEHAAEAQRQSAGSGSSTVEAIKHLAVLHPRLFKALTAMQKGPDGRISASTLAAVRDALEQQRQGAQQVAAAEACEDLSPSAMPTALNAPDRPRIMPPPHWEQQQRVEEAEMEEDEAAAEEEEKQQQQQLPQDEEEDEEEAEAEEDKRYSHNSTVPADVQQPSAQPLCTLASMLSGYRPGQALQAAAAPQLVPVRCAPQGPDDPGELDSPQVAPASGAELEFPQLDTGAQAGEAMAQPQLPRLSIDVRSPRCSSDSGGSACSANHVAPATTPREEAAGALAPTLLPPAPQPAAGSGEQQVRFSLAAPDSPHAQCGQQAWARPPLTPFAATHTGALAGGAEEPTGRGKEQLLRRMSSATGAAAKHSAAPASCVSFANADRGTELDGTHAPVGKPARRPATPGAGLLHVARALSSSTSSSGSDTEMRGERKGSGQLAPPLHPTSAPKARFAPGSAPAAMAAGRGRLPQRLPAPGAGLSHALPGNGSDGDRSASGSGSGSCELEGCGAQGKGAARLEHSFQPSSPPGACFSHSTQTTAAAASAATPTLHGRRPQQPVVRRRRQASGWDGSDSGRDADKGAPPPLLQAATAPGQLVKEQQRQPRGQAIAPCSLEPQQEGGAGLQTAICSKVSWDTPASSSSAGGAAYKRRGKRPPTPGRALVAGHAARTSDGDSEGSCVGPCADAAAAGNASAMECGIHAGSQTGSSISCLPPPCPALPASPVPAAAGWQLLSVPAEGSAYPNPEGYSEAVMRLRNAVLGELEGAAGPRAVLAVQQLAELAAMREVDAAHLRAATEGRALEVAQGFYAMAASMREAVEQLAAAHRSALAEREAALAAREAAFRDVQEAVTAREEALALLAVADCGSGTSGPAGCPTAAVQASGAPAALVVAPPPACLVSDSSADLRVSLGANCAAAAEDIATAARAVRAQLDATLGQYHDAFSGGTAGKCGAAADAVAVAVAAAGSEGSGGTTAAEQHQQPPPPQQQQEPQRQQATAAEAQALTSEPNLSSTGEAPQLEGQGAASTALQPDAAYSNSQQPMVSACTTPVPAACEAARAAVAADCSEAPSSGADPAYRQQQQQQQQQGPDACGTASASVFPDGSLGCSLAMATSSTPSKDAALRPTGAPCLGNAAVKHEEGFPAEGFPVEGLPVEGFPISSSSTQLSARSAGWPANATAGPPGWGVHAPQELLVYGSGPWGRPPVRAPPGEERALHWQQRTLGIEHWPADQQLGSLWAGSPSEGAAAIQGAAAPGRSPYSANSSSWWHEGSEGGSGDGRATSLVAQPPASAAHRRTSSSGGECPCRWPHDV